MNYIFFPREPRKNDIASIKFKRGDISIYFIEDCVEKRNSGYIKVREFVLPIEGSLTIADVDPYYLSLDDIENVVIAATMSENDYKNGHTFDIDISAQASLMQNICEEYAKNIHSFKQELHSKNDLNRKVHVRNTCENISLMTRCEKVVKQAVNSDTQEMNKRLNYFSKHNLVKYIGENGIDTIKALASSMFDPDVDPMHICGFYDSYEIYYRSEDEKSGVAIELAEAFADWRIICNDVYKKPLSPLERPYGNLSDTVNAIFINATCKDNMNAIVQMFNLVNMKNPSVKKIQKKCRVSCSRATDIMRELNKMAKDQKQHRKSIRMNDIIHDSWQEVSGGVDYILDFEGYSIKDMMLEIPTETISFFSRTIKNNKGVFTSLDDVAKLVSRYMILSDEQMKHLVNIVVTRDMFKMSDINLCKSLYVVELDMILDTNCPSLYISSIMKEYSRITNKRIKLTDDDLKHIRMYFGIE